PGSWNSRRRPLWQNISQSAQARSIFLLFFNRATPRWTRRTLSRPAQLWTVRVELPPFRSRREARRIERLLTGSQLRIIRRGQNLLVAAATRPELSGRSR